MIFILHFIFIFSFYLYIEKFNFGSIDFANVLFFFFYALFFTSLNAIITLSIKSKFAKFILNRIVVILSLIYGFGIFLYNQSNDAKITQEAIYALLQTNPSEIKSYIKNFIDFKYIALFILYVFSTVMFINKKDLKTHNIKRRYLLIIVLISIIVLNFTSSKIFSFLNSSIDNYEKEIQKFQTLKNKINLKNIKATKISKEPETYIVVIGESLNKNHQSLYGYVRNTTPNQLKLFAQDKLIRFDNAYSNHTHTMETLSLALTLANQYNQKDYFNVPNIVDVLKSAGFKTIWISNQVKFGDWNNQVSIIADKCDKTYYLNKSIGITHDASLDEVVLTPLKKELSKNTKNRVIFIHLMGNHWDYCDRFSSNFKIFQGKLEKKYFGNFATTFKLPSSYINCYDNSVLYNDALINTIISMLKNSTKTSSLIYFSDHSDDVNRAFGHDSNKFTPDMTTIPLIIWYSNNYKTTYPQIIKNLKTNSNKLFSNDLIFETILGLTNTHYDYNKSFDLTSDKYKLLDTQAKLLHGRANYNDPRNYIYWQKHNISKILNSKITPHRVDSLGKLSQVLYDGFKKIEVDVRFDENKKIFLIGHDKNMGINLSLEEYLDFFKINYALWIDLKNFNKSNYKDILSRLNYLDKKFNLKKRAMIESSCTKKEFAILKDNGYFTSYYLPTNLGKKDIKSIIDTIKVTKISSISFDSRLYDIVKEKIEPYINKNIVYNSWDLSLRLYQKDFIQKLQYQKMMYDSRVKTILVIYYSMYSI